MRSHEDDPEVKILRLETQRGNLIYALANSELSDELRLRLEMMVLAVQDELTNSRNAVCGW